MAINTPSFRKSIGSVAMTATHNTIVYDYFPMVSVPNRPIFWDSRYSQEWASGKVSYEHNKLLSSSIGMTVVEILNKRILGANLVYKPGKNTRTARETTDFIKNKLEELDFTSVVETANIRRLAGGSSYFVIQPDGDGIVLDAIGMDQAFVSFKGNKIDRVKMAINYYDDNLRGVGKSMRYFLIEERYYKKGIPYSTNRIYKSHLPQMQGTSDGLVSGEFSHSWRDDTKTKAVVSDYALLPEHVKEALKESRIELNVEFRLPFITLGVFHVKNTTSDTRHPNSKYGRPLLSGAYDIMWIYDFAFSVLGRDLQTGRALMFIPSIMNGNTQLQQSMGDNEIGNAYYNMKQEYPAIFDDEFVKIPHTSMEYQAPTNVQFKIRTEEIKSAMDDSATKLAQHVGISPTYLIAMLNQQNETKTATEVASDMSETNLTVLGKRRLLQGPINKLINEICAFYGKNGEDVFVTFPPLEEMNRSLTADYIVKLRSSKLMSDEMGVQYAYPELSEAEKEVEVQRIKDLRNEDNKLERKKEEEKVVEQIENIDSESSDNTDEHK